MAQASNAQPTAAYVPWGTLKNQLNRLCQQLPSQIDKSVFIGLAGGTQTQLLAALKFLGLVHQNHEPAAELREMCRLDESRRLEALRPIFKAAYREVFELDLKKATPEQLDTVMADAYGVQGSTLRKAVRFFLAGAKDLDIEVSEYLKRARRAKPRAAAKRRAKKAAPRAAANSGTSKTVALASGGNLTLSAELDLFSLNADDRGFVFELIDKLDKYEKALAEAQDENNDQDDEEGDSEQ